MTTSSSSAAWKKAATTDRWTEILFQALLDWRNDGGLFLFEALVNGSGGAL